MGKGKTENLKRFGKDIPPLSHERAVENGKKGGEKYAEKVRKTKSMKEMLEYLLGRETTGTNGEKITTLEEINISLVNMAKLGSVKAYTAIRDTIGQKPIEQVEQINLDIDAKPKKKDVKELKKISREIFGIDLDKEDD